MDTIEFRVGPNAVYTDLPAGESVAEVIGDLLAYEAEAFAEDTPLDLSDLCTWFGRTRARLMAALGRTTYEGIGGAIIAEALKLGAGYRDAAEEDQASGEEGGYYEEDEEISADLARADVLLTLAKQIVAGAGEPREIVVFMEGGVITAQTCDQPTPDLAFTVVDYDTEGAERGHPLTHMVEQDELPQGGGECERWMGDEIDGRKWARAYVAAGQEIELQPKPQIAPAAEARFDAAWED